MMNCGLHKVEGFVYDNGCELSFIKKNELPRTTSQVLIYFLPFQEFCLSGKDKLQQTKQRKVQHIERFISLTISKTLRD